MNRRFHTRFSYISHETIYIYNLDFIIRAVFTQS